MSEFVNTISVLGDDAVIDSIIERTIAEFKDDMITEIGTYAFYGCTLLSVVDLPNVVTLGGNAFQGCSSLAEAKLPNVKTFPSSAHYVFGDCVALTAISFPNLIDTNYYSFYNCSSLQSVDLPNLKTVSNQCFQQCTALEKLDLPCVKSIGSNGFKGCSALKTLVLRSETLCTLSNTNAFTGTPIASGSGYIYVPRTMADGSDGITAYEAASNWSSFAGRFRYIQDYTVDGTLTGELDENKI